MNVFNLFTKPIIKLKKSKAVSANSIMTIYAYKYHGQWVFDDEATGLDKEAFVAGADTLLDILTDNADKATLIFSSSPFPTAQARLTLYSSEPSGSVYYSDKPSGHRVWLCPALYLYFKKAPERLFVHAKPVLPKPITTL